MSQSISINQKMRDTIAHALTVKAVREAALKFMAEYRALNGLYWTEHQARVDKLIGFGKQKQATLIQAGMIRAESVVRPEIQQLDGDEFAGWGYPIHLMPAPELVDVLTDVGMFESSYGPLGSSRRHTSRHITLIFKSDRARPHLDYMQRVVEQPIFGRLVCLAAEAGRIIEAAQAFRSEAMKILTSCRTSRQLEDLWPEAAKLIPQPKNVGKSVVPKDAIDRVRTQLENGIPAGA